MGIFNSKNKQPKSETSKLSIDKQVMTSENRTTKSSSVTITKAVKISSTSTRTSVNSVQSHIIQSAGSSTATSTATRGPLQTYTPVYKRPSLSTSTDATVVASPMSTRPIQYSRPNQQISNTNLRPKETEYDLSKPAYVLVFHHDKFKDRQYDREGSIYDMQKIKEILKHYRCSSLDINENYPVKEVKNKMEKVSRQNFTKYSCLIVFIMSHGEINDTIVAYDGEMYSFHHDIVEQCTSNQTLKGKPKIFVVQACRGGAEMETDARRLTISDKTDIVAFQSSFLGTVSYRIKDQGSTFMQAFLRLLHANNRESIVNVNTQLNKEFKEKKLGQAPTLTTTLQKELIFGKLLKGS